MGTPLPTIAIVAVVLDDHVHNTYEHIKLKSMSADFSPPSYIVPGYIIIMLYTTVVAMRVNYYNTRVTHTFTLRRKQLLLYMGTYNRAPRT